MSLVFTVYGQPVPQGSMTPMVSRDGRVFAKHGKEIELKQWRGLIAQRAGLAMEKEDRPLIQGPVHLRINFYFPRPKGHYGTGKNAGDLKKSAPTFHTIRPDIDKLVRSVLDALTGVCWRDDSQVYRIEVYKDWGSIAHALIEVGSTIDWEEASSSDPVRARG
jgi:Holliday junction resolvase RusA-like endonuclease